MTISTCTRVCSKHFLPTDFMRTLTGKRNLKPECVPSVFQWSEDAAQQLQPTKKKNLGTNKNTLKPVQPVKQTETHNLKIMEPQQTGSFLDHCYDIPPISESEMLVAAREEITRLQQRTAVLEGKLFFLERFSNDSSMIYFYTGFRDYDALKVAFASLKPSSANNVVWNQCQQDADLIVKDQGSSEDSLSLIDQFFLFLCKVRQGFYEQDLAVRFNISQSTVTKIIITWANYMYILFRDMLSWPTRETINKCMPAIFQTTYPQARVILSSMEIKVQTSACHNPLSGPYLMRNKYTIFKGLLGQSPNGDYIFKSLLYSGTISANEITRLSGILELLEPNDVVIADTDFAIQALLASVDAHLVHYPFQCAISPSAQEMEEINEELMEVGEVEIEEVLEGEGSMSKEKQVVSVGVESMLSDVQNAVGEEIAGGIEGVSDTIGEKEVEATVELLPNIFREGMSNAKREKVPDAVGEEMPDTAAEEVSGYVGEEVKDTVVVQATFGQEVIVAVETNVADGFGEQAPYAIREEELTTQELEEASNIGDTNQIASLTVHIEEVVGRIKEYHLFDTIIPLTLATTVHQLWVVCAGLTKFSGYQG
ncbi:uncharacterized protein [Ambystoma mexicanum]|uniref:uncharacterized protein isoform X2 n=1 Tax=Ambystoma mexicanum TaxID=8296 RepID=UPI0037E87D80